MRQLRFTLPAALAGTLMLMPDPELCSAAPAAPVPETAALADIRRLLREAPLIDGHNDLPWQYRKHSNDLAAINLRTDTRARPSPLVTDIARLRQGGVGGQFWSVYVPASTTGAEAVQAVLEQTDVTKRFVAQYGDTFELASTADDVERIHRAGRIASLLGMEGGHSIGNSLAVLRMTHALGARYMTLTHTRNNDWADASTDEPRHRGLTPFGEAVVREMNRLGMIVDLSHASDDTARAALRATQAPVLFSHSGARAVCSSPRNVPDDILQQLPKNGGVWMACFLPGYVTEPARAQFEAAMAELKRLEHLHPGEPEQVRAGMADWREAHAGPPLASLKDVADHIDHVRRLIGVEHIGIGSDFEGYSGATAGLEDVSCYPALFLELRRRGYPDEDLKKIAGLNVLRVLRRVEIVARRLQAQTNIPSAE